MCKITGLIPEVVHTPDPTQLDLFGISILELTADAPGAHTPDPEDQSRSPTVETYPVTNTGKGEILTPAQKQRAISLYRKSREIVFSYKKLQNESI